MKHLKDFSIEPTQSKAALAIDLRSPATVIANMAKIMEWVQEPWDGPIPLPGWKATADELTKSEVGYENFLIIDPIEYARQPYPLLKLGCAAPSSMLSLTGTDAARYVNAPLLRAMIINALKLRNCGKGGCSTNFNVFWATLTEATGLKVVEEFDKMLNPFFQAGIMFGSDVVEEAMAVPMDARDFPDAAKPPVETNAWGRRPDMSYDLGVKPNKVTEAWMKQFKAFIDAKLSWVKGLKSTTHRDWGFSVSSYNIDNAMLTEFVSNIASVMHIKAATDPAYAASIRAIVGYEGINKASLHNFIMSDADTVLELSRDFKMNAFRNSTYARAIEEIVDVASRCGKNIKEMRGTRRDAHASLGITAYEDLRIIQGKLSKEEDHRTFTKTWFGIITKYAPNSLYLYRHGINDINPYLAGVPDTQEVHDILTAAGVKDVPEFHWPSNYVKLGDKYIAMAKANQGTPTVKKGHLREIFSNSSLFAEEV